MDQLRDQSRDVAAGFARRAGGVAQGPHPNRSTRCNPRQLVEAVMFGRPEILEPCFSPTTIKATNYGLFSWSADSTDMWVHKPEVDIPHLGGQGSCCKGAIMSKGCGRMK